MFTPKTILINTAAAFGAGLGIFVLVLSVRDEYGILRSLQKATAVMNRAVKERIQETQ